MPIGPVNGAGFLTVGIDNFANSVTVNSASILYGSRFKAAGTTLNAVRVAHGSNTGTAGNIKATVSIYAVGTNGYPSGAALGSVEVTTPTANAWNTYTFASPITLTVGTVYTAVLSNTASVPGTDYFRLLVAVDTRQGPYMGATFSSADGGSTWTVYQGYQNYAFGIYPDYATLGIVAPAVGFYTDIVAIYDDRRLALKVHPPMRMAVHRLVMLGSTNTGSPSYNLQGAVWDADGTEHGSSNIIPGAASIYYGFYWSDPIVIQANVDSWIGITCTNDTDGDASNCHRVRSVTMLDTSPYAGIVTGAQLYTGGSWADSPGPEGTLWLEAYPAGGVIVIDD